MEGIGEIFKAARQNFGWTVEDVAKKTKLTYAVIEAIENEDFSSLPSPTYVIGFIRNYAKLLGLNDKELVSSYLQQNKEASGTRLDLRDETVKRVQDKNFQIFLVFFLILSVLGGIGYGGYRFLASRSKKKEAQTKETVLPQEEQVKRPAPDISLIGRYQRIMMEKEAPKIFRTKIHLKIITDVFVSVSENDHLLFNGMLKAGSTESWHSEGTLRLKIGIPDAAQLFIKEKDMGIISAEKTSPYILTITGDKWKVSLPEAERE